MVEKEIRVHTTDGEMTTFVVRPDGEGPFPVAVVFMDGVGYREQVKKNARRFAVDGYYCVAPEHVVSDVKAMLDAITADGAAGSGPKVCVGYCLGARVALHVASAFPD